MKRNLLFLLALVFTTVTSVSGQTIYRSIASGAWNVNTTWEISTDNGASYGATTAAQIPTTNTSVIIQNGHTVNIPASITGNCLNLTVNAGGVLTDNGLARSIRPGSSSSGTSGTVATVNVAGTIGGSTDLLGIEIPITAASVTYTGAGTVNVGRIRAITGNSNYPTSATAGHANAAQLIIDCNMSLKVGSNYAFSGPNSTVTATDVFIYTINAGKTVTVVDPGSRWENTLMATGGATTGGSYTYNVNGTLDLSTTTAQSAFIPYANAASAINVNINGTVKLGTSFKADTVNTSAGAISLTIGNGGLLDGTLTTSFNANKRGTASGNIFFVTTGTGAIKRTVGAADTDFPIGTSTNNFNGVVMNNAGTSDAYTVSVKNTLDNAPLDASKIVTKQWTIAETVAGGTNAVVKFSWVTADQAGSFNPAGNVKVGRWTGSGYQTVPAVVTGTGTITDPYVATATITNVGLFVVGNATALPVSFAGAKAYTKEKGVQVEWSVATESDINFYSIERSINGKDFASIGIVESKGNSTTLSSYSFFDATPVAGTNYYRVKAQEKDGSSKYTAIMQVTIAKGKAEVIVAPNPVRNNNLNVQLSGLAKGNYTVRLFNSAGQVVFTAQVATEGGPLSQAFKLPATARAGVYTMQVSGNDVNLNKQVVIE